MPDSTTDATNPAAWPACPAPQDMRGVIEIAHGGGGRRTHQLIASIFNTAFGDPLNTHGHDGAVFAAESEKIAITTDSYVVQPLEFPGGNIGSMSVHGTINDLLMCGARPRYLSAAFVLEAGLQIPTLERIVSSMRAAADESGVQIVTGDTKVIGRSRGDGLHINTSGVGSVLRSHPVGPMQVTAGSSVIVSGDLGRHGVAVMSARESLDLGDAILSDSSSLCPAVLPLLESGLPIQCMRDLTRGGLATALVEIARTSRTNIELDEQDIPVSPPVRGACELLGLDPIYVANEGRFVMILPQEHAKEALGILRETQIARDATVIGQTKEGTGRVAMKTLIGTNRVVEMISGEQLPRIC